jgi:hypothetical protein
MKKCETCYNFILWNDEEIANECSDICAICDNYDQYVSLQ